MNILFSSDDNYARHLGVALLSLLIHNKRSPKILIYVVDNNICSDNILKLEQITSSFENAKMILIPFKKWSDRLHLNMAWPISLSSYARLFVAEMLPLSVDRLLYLDCDMLVNDDISDLWNTDLGHNIIGAIQDRVPAKVKISIGLDSNDCYFNAGMLLIDLKKWRNVDMSKKCLSFIESHHGEVVHHDQGVLNGVLKGHWLRLPLKFNVMTIHYMMSQPKIQKYFKDESSFYGNEEISFSKANPTILHFTPSFTSHPWERNCKHPLRSLYQNTLNETPWKGIPLENDRNPWYVQLLNLRYQYLPII